MFLIVLLKWFVTISPVTAMNDPISDFTRKRKLPVNTLIHFIIQMQSKSLNSELCEYFNDIDSLPTASALCQQSDKLDIGAFQRIMHFFANAFDDYKTSHSKTLIVVFVRLQKINAENKYRWTDRIKKHLILNNITTSIN